MVQGFSDPSSKLYTAKFATVADEPPVKKPRRVVPEDEGGTPKPKPKANAKNESGASGLSPALAAMLAAASARDDESVIDE